MTSLPRYKWQPTTADIARRFGILESEVVRFDHNTSPITTDWAAGIIAPMARTLNEYPGASYTPLRRSAASYLGVDTDSVVAGAGIDELILLAAKAFLSPGSRAAAAVPTYPLYEIATAQCGAEFRGISYTKGLSFPEEELSRVAETADLLWLCVPNNPTGERIEDATISRIVRKAKGVVVIDAAYAEFAGDDWTRWIERYDHVLVLHTMSKAFGLAGLRVGFAMGHADLVSVIDGVRPPGSIASISAQIAEMAFSEPQRMHRTVRRITDERTRLSISLTDLSFTALPSSANFVLSHVGPYARDLASSILPEGLIVRTFPEGHALSDYLRVTVRSTSDNDRLIDALTRHLPRHVDSPLP